MKILNFLKRKKTDEIREVSFLKSSFKERLKASNNKAYTVTVGIVYNDQVVRKFAANTKAVSKSQAGQKVRVGMSLQVIDVKRKKS